MSFSVALSPHPDSPASGIAGLWVEGHWEDDLLALTYRLAGDLNTLCFPTPENPAEPDRLWAHSCFEVFWARPDVPDAYCEYNFSPSGQWASYAFSAYRARAHQIEPLAPSSVLWQRTPKPTPDSPIPDSLYCSVLLPLPEVDAFRFGLAAVLERTDGRLCYFALRHPPGAPDFHHPINFALELSRHDPPFRSRPFSC